MLTWCVNLVCYLVCSASRVFLLTILNYWSIIDQIHQQIFDFEFNVVVL